MKKKIIGIYNNRPWLAAFIYPFIWVLIFGMFFMFFVYATTVLPKIYTNFLFVFVFIFLFIQTVVPIVWIIYGCLISKRKLPYILSLTLGLLFVLAAVGI